MLNDLESISPQLLYQIIVHGFLLWVSMGFLIPVGILSIRMSKNEEHGRKTRIMLCIHAVTQVSFEVNYMIIPLFDFNIKQSLFIEQLELVVKLLMIVLILEGKEKVLIFV